MCIELSVQIREMADPDWMYHKPDPWVQTLNKWESRKVEAYEQKDNDGVAFTNNKKVEEWHADFTGKAMVDGKMYWVAISDKTSKAGNPYKKLKFKPMEDQYSSPARESAPKDDIPW